MSKQHIWKLALSLVLAVSIAAPGVGARSAVFQSPVEPPTNDNFANALVMPEPGYSTWIDLTAATTEVNEPLTSCGYNLQRTTWFRFTAPQTGSGQIMFYGDYYYYQYNPTLALNLSQGTDLLSLNLMNCATWTPNYMGNTNLNFQLAAGETYYMQVGTTEWPSDNQLWFTFLFITPPPNDNFANATLVTDNYYYQTVDVSGATTESGEPAGGCGYTQQRTVWYAFTPASNGALNVSLWGNSGDGLLNAYRADNGSLGGLSAPLGCTYNGYFTFVVEANRTYYFQAGTAWSSSSVLNFSLSFIPAPPNDDFANATQIGTLPFDSSSDMTAASLEPNEPMPSCAYNANKSVWYSYTPGTAGSISQLTTAPGGWYSTVVAAYRGDSLNNLIEVACRSRSAYDSSLMTFHVEAGVTYYFQMETAENATLPFNLDVTPPPVASFYYNPYDPSLFDAVYFNDTSADPGNVGIQSRVWNFGDGSTSSDGYVSHRYAADGDYTVTLTVTTGDGRIASTTQVVRVRTHDVAIAKFTVPQSASAGQTRQLVVGVNSKRYTEDVRVELYKSLPGGGWQIIGTLQQTVPVRPANRTTDFSFTYTFTKADASIGKVTFRAIASLVSARDALPGDNEAIGSPPTKVSR